MCLCCHLVLDYTHLCWSIYLRGIPLGGLPSIFCQHGLTKKSSAQACQSDSLTQSTLLSLKTLGESKIGPKGTREGCLECLGAVLDEGWWAMNEWSSVRREERAIYTQRQIQPFRSELEVPTQIVETFGSTQKHSSRRQSTRLARKSSELPAVAGTSDFHRDSW